MNCRYSGHTGGGCEAGTCMHYWHHCPNPGTLDGVITFRDTSYPLHLKMCVSCHTYWEKHNTEVDRWRREHNLGDAPR